MDDLLRIVGYIADDNQRAAANLEKRIRAAVKHTGRFPYMYPASERFPGYRRVVAHHHYVVYYQVLPTHIEVRAVYDARGDAGL
ncbi:MAG: type II toxin-antitoxin system RelE/ParE family toxin [Lautropia sp.]|nr:type II toxin-antitoxin system RelE/ParE family toxin [Lautropia sp.]